MFRVPEDFGVGRGACERRAVERSALGARFAVKLRLRSAGHSPGALVEPWWLSSGRGQGTGQVLASSPCVGSLRVGLGVCLSGVGWGVRVALT